MAKNSSELISRVANMVAYSVPNGQIAAVCGVEDADLQLILNTKEFQDELAAIEFANVDRQKTLNDGWDTLENIALSKVVTAMDTMLDPDFALKVAAVANKASRRGGRFNRPIEGDLGSRAVINLNPTFIQRLQQTVSLNGNSDSVTKPVDAQKQKDHDFLAPNKVEKLLKLPAKQVEAPAAMDMLLNELPSFV
jgi:hypothetical protein